MFNPNNNNKFFYKDPKLNFTVWSKSTFFFDDKQLRLPQMDSINSGFKFTYKFESESKRKNTLHKLYKTLNNWSNLYFHDDTSNRVTLDEEYWYIS